MLQSESSIKSIVNIPRQKLIWKGNYIEASNFSTNILYKSICKDKTEPSIGVSKWMRILQINENLSINQLYVFMFHYLEENKLKIYRWKLLQFILPTKQLLFKWKQTNDNLCNVCNEEEDYNHFFISCRFLEKFWKSIHELMIKSNLNFRVSLKQLVFGYKIFDKNYFGLNYFLTILGFSIYKSYYVSNQKLTKVNVYQIFVREYIKRYNENRTMKLNPLLKSLKRSLDD